MAVTITNVPERTYTGAGTASPSVLLTAGVWREFAVYITLSNAARAKWTIQNPNVVGEIAFEQDFGDGSGFLPWCGGMFSVGDGDPNLLNAAGNQIGLPAIYTTADGMTRSARAKINVYTASPTGTLSIVNGTYNIGGSFTAGLRLEVVS